MGSLTRIVGDFGLAEDLAQEALVDALRQWPIDGVPRNAAAWLNMAKRKAIDGWRRRERLEERIALIAHDLEREQAEGSDMLWDPVTVGGDGHRACISPSHHRSAVLLGALRGYHLLPATRGELLLRLGREDEARSEFAVAAGLAGNDRERALLERKTLGHMK